MTSVTAQATNRPRSCATPSITALAVRALLNPICHCARPGAPASFAGSECRRSTAQQRGRGQGDCDDATTGDHARHAAGPQVFGAGVAFAAVWMVSAALFTAVPHALELRDATAGTADLVRLLPAIGRQQLLQGGGFAGTLVLLAASVTIYRTAVLPKWLTWFGVVGGDRPGLRCPLPDHRPVLDLAVRHLHHDAGAAPTRPAAARARRPPAGSRPPRPESRAG
jgi:hypothetical protein